MGCPFLKSFLLIVLALALMLVAVRCWGADEVHWNSKQDAPKWGTSDTVITTFAVLAWGLDYSTTLQIAHDPTLGRELNIITGPHPSERTVHQYMLSAAVITAIACYFIPSYRKAILGGVGGVSAMAGGNNLIQGLRPWRK